MIRGTLRMDFEIGAIDAVLAALRGLIGPTRSRAGCLDCCLCEDPQIQGRVKFCTWWKDRQSVERFIQSTSFGQVLALMELASRPPEVLFDDVNETQGMDYVATVRSKRIA